MTVSENPNLASIQHWKPSANVLKRKRALEEAAEAQQQEEEAARTTKRAKIPEPVQPSPPRVASRTSPQIKSAVSPITPRRSVFTPILASASRVIKSVTGFGGRAVTPAAPTIRTPSPPTSITNTDTTISVVSNMSPHSDTHIKVTKNPFVLATSSTHISPAAVKHIDHEVTNNIMDLEVTSNIGPTFTVPTSPSVSSISSDDDDDDVEPILALKTTDSHAPAAVGATFQAPDWSLSTHDTTTSAVSEGSSMSVDAPQQPVYQRVPVSQWNNADYDQYLRVEHGWSLEMLQNSLEAIQSGGLPPFVESARNIMKDLHIRAVKEIETEKSAHLNRLRKQAARDIEAEKVELRKNLEQEHKELKQSIALLQQQKAALQGELQAHTQNRAQSLSATNNNVTPALAALSAEPNPSLNARQLESYERQMTATNKYTPKQPSRLRKVSRLSSSSLGSPQSPAFNFHADATMDDAHTLPPQPVRSPPNSQEQHVPAMTQPIPLWVPSESMFSDPEARAAASTLNDTTPNPFLADHFVRELSYDDLTAEEAAEVRAAVETMDDPAFDRLLPGILTLPQELEYDTNILSAEAQAEVRAFGASV